MEIKSERARKIQDIAWTSGVIMSRDLPRDCVLKRLQFRLSGSTSYTFSSTPVAYEVSTFDNLVNRLDCVINGSRVVKSVRPHLLQMEQLLASTVQAERKASAAGAAAAQNNPLADAGFVYGTTGQFTTVAETVVMSFEMILSKQDQQSSLLNLRGAASAEVRLSCGTTAGLDKTTNATFVTPSFNIEVVTTEAGDVPATTQFSDWKQSTKEIVLTAPTTDYAIDINRGNFLTGIKIFATQDAAGVQSTASLRRQPTNFMIDSLKLVLNGSTLLKVTTFQNLQAHNRQVYGIYAPYASSQSRLDGFAYLDVLEGGKLRTALDCRPPRVDNLQLLVTTKTADTTYNNYNASITLETGELVPPA